MTYHVYVIEVEDGRLYTGHTNDLKRRLREHRNGTGAKFIRSFGFKRLIGYQTVPTKKEAVKREATVKRMSHQQKIRCMDAT